MILCSNLPFSDLPIGYYFLFDAHGLYKNSSTTGSCYGQIIEVPTNNLVEVPQYAWIQEDEENEDCFDYPRLRIQVNCPDETAWDAMFQGTYLRSDEARHLPILAGTVIRLWNTQPRSENMSE